jgi:glc operon protein GlcG
LSFLLIVIMTYIIYSADNYAQLLEKKTISLELAKKNAASAETEAEKNSWTVVICVLDDGGNLVYLEKMDNTQNGSIEVAIQKARTAVFFKRPTKVFEDMVGNGRNSILGLQNVMPIEGGLPLIVNGQIIGAIGVSGAKSNEDGIVAKAGADFLLGQ